MNKIGLGPRSADSRCCSAAALKKIAMPISINNLETSAGGHFFRPTANLDAASIETLFDDIKKQWAKSTPLARDVRLQRTTAGTQYFYSFLCIKMKPSEPPFLPKSGLSETRYGFVLLIEIAGLLGLFKRGPTGFEDWIETTCDRIGTQQLTRVYASNAIYGKISLRRMTVSQQELRACSYEAANLATTIPALGLGRSVPRFIKLNRPIANNSTETISIVPATSRISKSGKKLSVDELAKVVTEIAGQVANPAVHGFLDVFPLPVALSALPAGVLPTSVLFDLSGLDESAAQASCQVILRRNGRTDQDVTNIIKKRFEEILPLNGLASPYFFGRGQMAVRGELRQNLRTFSIKFRTGLDLIVQDSNGVETSFELWIRERQNFSVGFSLPQYFYTQGQLYQRADFNHHISLVESVLKSEAELERATSEKGKTENYTQNTRNFAARSIFAFVERTLCRRAKHLWCCDLGDEWADYVAITPGRLNEIQFLHCKAGDETCGASAFHEVIGQALKNLGRVQVTPQEMHDKITLLNQRPNWGATSIRRYRGTGNFEADAISVIAAPEKRQVVGLVVTMLSKQRFQAARAAQDRYFVQLVWILTSFISSCREMGATPKIYCRP